MSTYAFCIVQPDSVYPERAYGPQGKLYTVVGRLPDGRAIGASEVYPSELAIIASPAHGEEYLGSSWNDLLAGPYAAQVDWLVEVEDADGGTRWMREAELTDETVLRTPAGHRRRRPPVSLFGAERFDPDHVPAVGTVRVLSVEGGDDRVQVVRTGPGGERAWYDVQTLAASA